MVVGMYLGSSLVVITWKTGFSFVSVHDEAIPGSTQHTTQLRYSKGIDVLTHCRNPQTRRRWLNNLRLQ